jgi:hypothetical protein
METADFIKVWNNPHFEKLVCDMACSRSRKPEVQKELIQEAALALSCAPPFYTFDKYYDICFQAMRRGAFQEYCENRIRNQLYLLMNALPVCDDDEYLSESRKRAALRNHRIKRNKRKIRICVERMA